MDFNDLESVDEEEFDEEGMVEDDGAAVVSASVVLSPTTTNSTTIESKRDQSAHTTSMARNKKRKASAISARATTGDNFNNTEVEAAYFLKQCFGILFDTPKYKNLIAKLKENHPTINVQNVGDIFENHLGKKKTPHKTYMETLLKNASQGRSTKDIMAIIDQYISKFGWNEAKKDTSKYNRLVDRLESQKIP